MSDQIRAYYIVVTIKALILFFTIIGFNESGNANFFGVIVVLSVLLVVKNRVLNIMSAYSINYWETGRYYNGFKLSFIYVPDLIVLVGLWAWAPIALLYFYGASAILKAVLLEIEPETIANLK